MDFKADAQRMEKIVSLCKRRGFIFQSSEIYGGLSGCWDYGPLGVELKRNLKNYWWHVIVHERDDVVGMDGSILMNRAVWKASGHEDTSLNPPVPPLRYRSWLAAVSFCSIWRPGTGCVGKSLASIRWAIRSTFKFQRLTGPMHCLCSLGAAFP